MFDLGSMLALTTSMKVGGSLLAGYEQADAARTNYATAQYQARQAEKTGLQQAAIIRKEGAKTKGAAEAALGKYTPGQQTGTGALLLQEIAEGVEVDAMNAILSGDSAALSYRISGMQSQARAKQARNASLLGAFDAIGSGALQYGQLQKQGLIK